MMATLARALLAHWGRNPLQIITLLSGLALASALWSGVQAVNSEARASYEAAAATLGEGRFDQILAPTGAVPEETYIALRRAGWMVSPVLEGRTGGVRVVGLDPLTSPSGLGPVAVGQEVDLAAFLTYPGQIFGRPETLAALPDGPEERIASADVAPGTILTDIAVAQRLLGRTGSFDRLIVSDLQPDGRPALEEVAPGLRLRPGEGGTDLSRLTDSFHLNLTAFGLLSFAVGIFIVHGAIGLSIEQRRPVIRTLRAIGAPLGAVMVVLVLELAAMSILAGSAGLVLGHLIAGALLPDVAATLRGLYGADVSGELSFRPGWALAALGMTLIGAATAGAGALVRIARMPLLASAQPRAWAVGSVRARRLQAGSGLALLLAAAAGSTLEGGLITGFAILGAALLGGALVLPVVIATLLRQGERLARGPLSQWFWADSRQQLPGLSLALMALLLAMAANVGVSTMVSSFRQTFAGFLDQRLVAELYLSAETPAQAAELESFLADRVRTVLPRFEVPRDLAGLPGDLLAARDDATFRDHWTFLAADPDPWGQLAAGAGVLINEQLSRRAGLAVGDALSVADGLSLRVIGIYGDYGNPVGQAIIAEALFRDLYPEVEATRLGLRLPTEEVPDVVRALTVEFGLDRAQIIDQAAIKALSMEVFERTFAVTGVLNVLTLAVAGFAMLMSLLTLAALRLPQVAPIWALGVSRRWIGGLELVRAVLMAGLVAVLALPLGLVLAWLLLAVVNVAAFGWRLPMFLFPLDWVRLGVLTLVAAALAALWPGLRLARTPPAHLIKVFSGER